MAIFIDDVIQLTDQLSLVLGARYDDIEFDRYDLPIGGAQASAFDAT